MTDLPRHWKPLVKLARGDFKPPHEELIAYCMNVYGETREQALDRLVREHNRSDYYVNNLYQVMVTELTDDYGMGGGPGMLHINIRRRDGSMFKDWQHFQQIKNEIAGPEREAVEIYPAESRLTDTSNKWHLWVMPENMPLPFGFPHRDVNYDEYRDVPGMRQRPL